MKSVTKVCHLFQSCNNDSLFPLSCVDFVTALWLLVFGQRDIVRVTLFIIIKHLTLSLLYCFLNKVSDISGRCWKLLAKNMGLSAPNICCLSERYLCPGEALINWYLGQQVRQKLKQNESQAYNNNNNDNNNNHTIYKVPFPSVAKHSENDQEKTTIMGMESETNLWKTTARPGLQHSDKTFIKTLYFMK